MKVRKQECQICFEMRRPTDFVSPCAWCKDKQRICKLCCAKLCKPQQRGRLLYKCVACRRTSLLRGEAHDVVFRSPTCLRCILCSIC